MVKLFKAKHLWLKIMIWSCVLLTSQSTKSQGPFAAFTLWYSTILTSVTCRKPCQPALALTMANLCRTEMLFVVPKVAQPWCYIIGQTVVIERRSNRPKSTRKHHRTQQQPLKQGKPLSIKNSYIISSYSPPTVFPHKPSVLILPQHKVRIACPLSTQLGLPVVVRGIRSEFFRFAHNDHYCMVSSLLGAGFSDRNFCASPPRETLRGDLGTLGEKRFFLIPNCWHEK